MQYQKYEFWKGFTQYTVTMTNSTITVTKRMASLFDVVFMIAILYGILSLYRVVNPLPTGDFEVGQCISIALDQKGTVKTSAIEKKVEQQLTQFWKNNQADATTSKNMIKETMLGYASANKTTPTLMRGTPISLYCRDNYKGIVPAIVKAL
jgi:hypothetical protein